MSWMKRFLNSGYVGTLSCIERRLPFWPVEWIERLQCHRIHSIIRHAYRTVPFYRRAMDERGLRPEDFQTVDDLTQLPLIDSFILRNNLDRFTSTCYDEGSRQVWYSSGSQSRAQRTIYWDNASILRELAYAERDRGILNHLIGQSYGQRQLYIFPPTSLTLKIRAFWSSQTLAPRGLAHRQFISIEEPFEAVVEKINTFRPQVVFSYGSYADQFFRFLSDRQWRIALPRVWMYGGDLLSPGGRDLIEKTFGCLVYSAYLSAEAGRIGFQCEYRQGFHLNIDLCAVRLVDEKGRTVPPGEPGEVVISNLRNLGMVLLNYRQGDQGILAQKPCPCGRSLPLLEQLSGRCTDVIRLPNGRELSFLMLEALFKHELKSTLQSRVIQPAPGQIQWQIVPFSSTDRKALQNQLLERARSVLGTDTQVTVEFVEHIPLTPQGKFLRVMAYPEGAKVKK
ncbi:MAG TPA: hypothetical protein VNM22_08365 [Candidatus Limnocylindrales bacterium]|nr:hypothetical protein [Candidatus Limnocylindrales bacterium]